MRVDVTSLGFFYLLPLGFFHHKQSDELDNNIKSGVVILELVVGSREQVHQGVAVIIRNINQKISPLCIGPCMWWQFWKS